MLKHKIKDQLKVCLKCEIEQPITEFHKNKQGRDGRQPRCRTCLHKQQREYRKSNGYGSQIKYKYGITLDEYKLLLQKQENKCVTCGTVFDVLPGRLYKPVIDHCHTTNKVRGILCHPCNVAIGLLKENLGTIQNIYKYLS